MNRSTARPGARNAKPSAGRPATGGGQVRIIGGQWRRRVLRVADVPGLRPTPDRVRETLFNWLGQDMTGRNCLDLFAGSGALGLEALSRDARGVVFVESDGRARRALEEAAATLGAGARARIEGIDALQFLQRTHERFDVIFLDPPFGQGWLAKVWGGIERVATPETMIYVEAESAFVPPAPWRVVRSARAGAVHFQLANRKVEDE
jgi:16S rRNA (guanine(966)-N(2))-methyltransferase RsmD